MEKNSQDVGATIRSLRKSKQLTLEQVASRVGIDTGNLSRIERGVQNASLPRLKRIADALSVPVSALVAGVESPPSGRSVYSRSVPLIPWESLAEWSWEPAMEADTGEWFPIAVTRKLECFATRFDGDSMMAPGASPSIMPGSILTVCQEPHTTGSLVIVVDQEGHAMLKQFVKDGGRCWLKALNPIYPLIEFDEESMAVIGVVKEASYRQNF